MHREALPTPSFFPGNGGWHEGGVGKARAGRGPTRLGGTAEGEAAALSRADGSFDRSVTRRDKVARVGGLGGLRGSSGDGDQSGGGSSKRGETASNPPTQQGESVLCGLSPARVTEHLHRQRQSAERASRAVTAAHRSTPVRPSRNRGMADRCRILEAVTCPGTKKGLASRPSGF